jgi:hypothetical protein
MDKGVLKFDIKTGMKNIIGRDLITDDFIAIYELVKNSYDAYADYVKLTFSKDEIIITDNGKGMSKRDLTEKWFAVAYSAKTDGSEDADIKRNSHLNNLKSRRFYAGAKGVGRFSCDRLGGTLELITSKINSNQTYKIDVDWSEFEKDSKQSFGSIDIPFEEINHSDIFPKNANHGTILKIQNLNSIWDENRLIELRRSLEKLINPFSKDNIFSIEIEAKEFLDFENKSVKPKKINGIIDNSILKVLDIKTTQIDLKLKNEIITTKIIDRGTLIYHIEEPNPYKSVINDLEINLYFLNKSAKINFGKLMDIEPVNYGNVFLFKNGFRVQPYGNVGDDSWEIDNRKQQGYNRRLGTRDLFGKVDLITENFNEFKEVSSRDGGLVQTIGKKLLFEIFIDKAFKRLERYVVGVLWGEAFKRKNYFLDESLAEKYRDELDKDKDKDSYEDALTNLGSKIDFVNLIKTLSDDKEIRIISYNKELVNLVNERLDEVQSKFLSELEKIAEKTNDVELLNQVRLTEENFNKIIQEKEEAIKRAYLEEKRRNEAEKKAEEEENKRIEAERKQKEEEEKRRNAELETLKKEKERAEAELAKIKAEQKAREEEDRAKKENEARLKAERAFQVSQEQNKYLLATSNTSEEVKDLIHTINISSSNISASIGKVYKILKDENITNHELLEQIEFLKFNSEKIELLGSIITKANVNLLKEKKAIDIPVFIKEYIQLYEKGSSLTFNIVSDVNSFKSMLNLLDIYLIFDNLISNSKKSNASKIKVVIHQSNNKLFIDFSDNGDGLSDEFLLNPDNIFKIGITDKSGGSGIGLHTLKKILKDDLHGDIIFMGNNIVFNSGATFRLIFAK